MQLLTGNAIAAAVCEVLGSVDDHRIIVVAFVGKDPLRWIAAPKGLQLYCWPHPGGTHPDGIRALLRAGVHVNLVPQLHAKVYWSRRNGAVLGSANLSHSALGDDGLYEAAVRLAAGELDINKLLDTFQRQAINSDDCGQFKALLERLDIEHTAYVRRNGVMGKRPISKAPTFGEWLKSPVPKRWQIDYWTYSVDINPTDPADDSGTWPYACSANASKPDALHLNVPTLELPLNRAGTRIARGSKPSWWYPETTYVTTADEYKEIPYTWVCTTLAPPGEVVPFNPNEVAFRHALTYALDNAGDEIENIDGYVNPAFLQALVRGYSC